MGAEGGPAGTIQLADWRRRVAMLHLGFAGEGEEAVAEFRERRDELFLNHPVSPLNDEQRGRFEGLPHFPFDPAARVECELQPPPDPNGGEPLAIDTGGPDGTITYSRVGLLETPWGALTLFWTEGYGGGLFLPFRDETAPAETYGAGRYLTDTIKGTFAGGLELPKPVAEGPDSPRVTLDFNYAYNPSCAYNSHWACPLAPPENRLERPIRAGELAYPDPA